jgi:pyrroline-5-carboxylate reductase
MTTRIAFIGGGNMGRAIIGGLLQRGTASDTLCVADPLASTRDGLARDFGVRTVADNLEAVAGAEAVVLAVKPQQMREAVTPLGPALAPSRPVVLSIAAGITTESLREWLGVPLPLVRAMPNTPALIGRGVSALYATRETPPDARAIAADLLGAVGSVTWVDDEPLLDAVTAVSGSGPAYVFLFIECLEHAGVALGLPPATARQLAIETTAGAAELARSSPLDPGALRVQVTSKGGTVAAAARRASELSQEFGAC